MRNNLNSHIVGDFSAVMTEITAALNDTSLIGRKNGNINYFYACHVWLLSEFWVHGTVIKVDVNEAAEKFKFYFNLKLILSASRGRFHYEFFFSFEKVFVLSRVLKFNANFKRLIMEDKNKFDVYRIATF